MIRRFLAIAVIVLIPGASPGQDLTGGDTRNAPVSSLLQQSRFKKFSLIDPSKIQMSQSYTMLFSSGSGGREAAGVYVNTISYRFSPSMLLNMHLGVQNTIMSSQRNVGQSNQSRIVPGFDFTYRPTENTFFHVSYGTARSRYLNGRYLATDPGWFEGTSTTSPFLSDSPDRDLMISP